MGLVLRSRRKPADRCGRQRPPPAPCEPPPARRRPHPDRGPGRADPGAGAELSPAGTPVRDIVDRFTPGSSRSRRIASRPGPFAVGPGAGPGDAGGDRAARRGAVRRPSCQARRPTVAVPQCADGARSPQGAARGTRPGPVGRLRDVRRAGPDLLGAAETALPAGPLPRFPAPGGPGVGDRGSPARQLPALRGGERDCVACAHAVQHLCARFRPRAGPRGPCGRRRVDRGEQPVAPQAGRDGPPAGSRRRAASGRAIVPGAGRGGGRR